MNVYVRVRPQSELEKKDNDSLVVTCDKRNVSLLHGAQKRTALKQFVYDQVFGQFASQTEVYETACLPLVQDVLDGFSCTVFAYGATGSGKTHTIEGDFASSSSNTELTAGAGIMPRAATSIFNWLSANAPESIVKVSFAELCQSKLRTTSGTFDHLISLSVPPTLTLHFDSIHRQRRTGGSAL